MPQTLKWWGGSPDPQPTPSSAFRPGLPLLNPVHPEPYPRHAPVPSHRTRRTSHRCRNLPVRHPGEKLQPHHPARRRANPAQPIQQIPQLHSLEHIVRARKTGLVQTHSPVALMLVGSELAPVIDQNPPHMARRRCIIMNRIAPARFFRASHPQPRLMHQGVRLKRMPSALSCEQAPRRNSKHRINGFGERTGSPCGGHERPSCHSAPKPGNFPRVTFR